jgi:2-haloacid dehalogenase
VSVVTPSVGTSDAPRLEPGSGRWVTFDCFGTLVDWHNGFAAVVEPMAGERTADVLREYHRFERLLERDSPHRLYRDVLAEALARAARSVGVPLTDAEARRLPESWGRLPVFGDVEPMLASLRDAGYRLGVLTNCDEDLFDSTHRSFLRRFEVVVTAERVRDYKPAPAHFRYFERLTGVRRNDWVHVACSFYHDVAPARELSVRCVWLDRDRTGEDRAAAAAYARGTEEVPAAVKALFLL